MSVYSVNVHPTSVTLRKGQWCYSVYADVLASSECCTDLVWYSDEPAIASVNQSSGYIYAASTGTTRIYAVSKIDNSKKDYCVIEVLPPIAVTGISLCPESKTMCVGETTTLNVTVCPSNATNKRVTWCSSNENVACVNYYTGEIAANALGEATITATTVDGNYAANCVLNVSGPDAFDLLIRHGFMNFDDIAYTDDDFYITMKSLGTILCEGNVPSLLNSSNETIMCNEYFDDWYMFAVPSSEGYTYGLYKMREQETDLYDNNDPGVTISFVEFNPTILWNCILSNTESNKQFLYAHLNNVVAEINRNNVIHNDDIYNYFRLSEKNGPYLIVEKYVEFIGRSAKNNYIAVPTMYNTIYVNNKKDRIPKAIDDNNSSAGYTVCDHNKIYILNPNELTAYEKYAIMMTHTANVTYNSFAAEVVFHARALTDNWSTIDAYYTRAIRADMAIGEEYEIVGIGIFDEYYNLNSSIVQEQVKHHGKK